MRVILYEDDVYMTIVEESDDTNWTFADEGREVPDALMAEYRSAWRALREIVSRIKQCPDITRELKEEGRR